MVTNPSHLDQLLHSFQRSEDLSLEKKFAIVTAMYRLACRFGQFTSDRALEGIEHDVQLAARLHSLVRTTSH